MEYNFNNIPSELKTLKNWVLWKYEEKPDGTYTKPLYQINGRKASKTDPNTWTTFNKAESIFKQGKYNGIGFNLTNTPYVGIDLDDCLINGTITPEAQDIIHQCGSYTELSPSGTGVHIIVKGELYGTSRKSKVVSPVEIYNNQYFTMTGNLYNGIVKPIYKRQEAIEYIHRLYLPKKEKAKSDFSFNGESLLTDDEVIEKASQANNGEKFLSLWHGDISAYNNDDSSADLALCNILAKWCCRDSEQIDRLFRQSSLLRDKWDEVHRGDGATYGQMTIEKAIAGCKNIYLGAFFEGKTFKHNVFGDYLITTLNISRINDALHLYDDNMYQHCDETLLHGYMLKLIPTLPNIKRQEVYKYVKVNLDIPKREVSPPNLIPFKSKIYDLETNKFIDYSPNYVFLNKLPYDYNPKAEEAPLVKQTVSQIAENDNDIINLLYEAIGYCFYRLNIFRGAVMLYGENGSNGKSTLLNMIRQLLGKENTSALSFQDMSEKFRISNIYGKMANLGDDIPNTYITDNTSFKRLVTGEKVTGERKGQDPIDFISYAKIFFSLNNLPPVNDKTKGMFDRILLIPLNADFSKSKNVYLKDRTWTQTEMEYFTRLSMDGLKRLMNQNDFTRPPCVIEALRQYEVENNPVLEFIESQPDIEGQPIAQVFDIYKYWAYDAGYKRLYSRTGFTREVCRATGLKSESIRHEYFGDKTGRCFVKK